MAATKINANKKSQTAAYDPTKLNAKDVNDLQDAVNDHADLLDDHEQILETLPTGTAAELVLFVLNSLPGYDPAVAQFVTHDAGGTWRAATLNMSSTGGGTVTPAPVEGQPAMLTASKTDLAIKDYRDLTTGGTGVDRFVKGKDGTGWKTGGNTGNFPRKATLDVDFVLEATFRADSQKTYLGMVTDNNNALNGWSAGTSIAIIDGRVVVNKNGAETDLGAAPALSATTKLALVGIGANVTLWSTPDATTYTKVSGFAYTRTGDSFFMTGADGPAVIYNIQHINLISF